MVKTPAQFADRHSLNWAPDLGRTEAQIHLSGPNFSGPNLKIDTPYYHYDPDTIITFLLGILSWSTEAFMAADVRTFWDFAFIQRKRIDRVWK